MSNIIKSMAAAALAIVAISSCENDDLNIGQSLTSENDKLTVANTSYDVTTRTIMADSVLSLSADCYLGRIQDPETGAYVTSEFTTQFHLLESTFISPEEKIVTRHDGRAAADSCDIVLYIGSPFHTADSLAAMKMRVVELAKPMTEGERYYSNFSLKDEGLLRQGGINLPHVFSFANLGEQDTIRTASSYQDCIRIPLNKSYTATDGTVYNNFGTYIMRQYYDHPEYFANSYTFAHSVCPGFYFQITDGLGFHAKVTNIGLRTFYRLQGDTAVTKAQLVLAGTREVTQTTHVTNDSETLRRLAAERGYTYLKTPAGLFTEVTLPITQIKQGHESDSLLAAKLTFQRMNSQSFDERLLPAPSALLLVQKDSLHSFFEKGYVPDNIRAYITGYNTSTLSSSSYSSDNTYTFNNLSSLVTMLWQTRQAGIAADPQWEAKHPDWNKMVLVPVTYTTSSTTTTTVASVSHDMSITSTRLVGGPENSGDPIKINIVYAKFK
jgi:hypothetical protein